MAAGNFRAGDQLIPGTGEQVWANLFEAARRFSTEIAYPNKPFPNVDADAKCPLCQQQLDVDAARRLRRFEDFVKQDTAKIAADKRDQLQKAEQRLAGTSVGFGLDAAITEEIKQMDAALLQGTQAFEKKVEARKLWLLGAGKTHASRGTLALDGNPRAGLKSLSTKFVTEAAEFDKASDEKQRKTLEAERAELRARGKLAVRLRAVLDLIERMRISALLTKCKDDLKTKAISDKAREFASKAVTAALKSALDQEFQALGVGHIKTKLNERVELGRMKHKLVLDLPVTKKLDEILSEGEQRAIAIGSFLADCNSVATEVESCSMILSRHSTITDARTLPAV